MPRLLKGETNRRLIVSQNALAKALALLATPRTVSFEETETDGAIEIGLIGIAADLAISACLYEVHGVPGIIRSDTGFYLSAGEALAAFRATLFTSVPRLVSLTRGVSNPTSHLRKLDSACSGFSVIFTSRAAAVHGGAGVSRDVAFCAGKSVADFLLTLAESPKWKPYLKEVPLIPSLPRSRTLIAQDLAASLSAVDKSKAAASLTGIFLVLPELTAKEPDWVQTLQRVQVTPRRRDISVLIKTLQQAHIGDLFKVGKGADSIATKIDPGNPNALPIYIAGMKKKFDKPVDAWAGYIGTANGQMDKEILSLPPIDVIYMFAATGIENIGLPFEETESGMSAHSIWPFVAGALDYIGTKGPCFFLVRALKIGEWGQLSALLEAAASCSKKLRNALTDYQPLLEAVAENRAASPNSVLGKQMVSAVDAREERRDKLVESLKVRVKRSSGTGRTGYEALLAEVQKTDALAVPINLLCEKVIDVDANLNPAFRLLIDAANAREDLAALVSIVAKNRFPQVTANARKAIMEIDYSFFGPKIGS